MALDLIEVEEGEIGDTEYCRPIDLSKEIFHWRKLLREKKYTSQPMSNRSHVSTSGQ